MCEKPSRISYPKKKNTNFSENSSILLDCGEGTCGQIYRYYGTQANNIFANIRAVFISHLHVDHYTGCCELIRIRKKLQLNQKSPLFIFATPEFASYLKNYQKNIDSTAVDYVIISNTDLVSPKRKRRQSNFPIETYSKIYYISL